ncbi:MAG TPA: rRNA maturation RNase YbeY [Candidatus Izemoplasmatales bacterium]|nr:rRNA maturation RNase YbeY [Candidatus Izemoplasmatales bacterium]
MITTNIINQYDTSDRYHSTIEKIIVYAYKYLELKSKKVINVILLDDEEIQSLNAKYRQINKATDVLSFENTDSQDELGDIFISIDKVKAQAMRYHHSFERELAFLSLHGFLHCMGYDHITKEDEFIMFKLQDDVIENTEFRRTNHYEK